MQQDYDNEIAPNWLVKDVIRAGTFGLILAQSGTGKSYLVEDLATKVAWGLPFMGKDVVPGDVLLIDEDTPEEIFIRRMRKFKYGLGESICRVIPHVQEGLSLSDGSLVKRVEQAIEFNPMISLIIIDALVSVSGKLNVNSNQDMGVLSKLRKACQGRTIIIVHHISEKKKFTADEIMTGDKHDLAMGASSIVQQCDFYMPIANPHPDNKKLSTLYIRPISKRFVGIDPSVTELIETDESMSFTGLRRYEWVDPKVDMVMTLFKMKPKVRSVLDVYNDLTGQMGIEAVRDTLHIIERKKLLDLDRGPSNLFKYSLPKPKPADFTLEEED